jgi:site-specific DNA-cytosine methylase
MSGRVRMQFARRGWNAWSADLLPDETHLWNEPPYTSSDGMAGVHYQGDVLDIIREDWDLVIAHPPCTDLSQAGARYWAQKQADGRQREAVDFFMKMLRMPRPEAYVVIENPVGFIPQVFRDPDQVVEPWMFGDPLAKKTCLWYRPSDTSRPHEISKYLDHLPHLTATHALADYPDGVKRTVTGGGSWRTDAAHGKSRMNNWEDSQGRARRHILRSLTPEGFAKACAEQWGSYVEGRTA